MTRFGWHLALIGIVVLVLVASCGPRGAGSQTGTMVRSYHPDKLVENSRIVANRLKVLHRDADRVNGLLRIQITVENVTDERLQFEYRYTWFDASGFEIETPMSNWQTVVVNAKDEAYMSGVAPNAVVEDFKFVVRYPNRW